MAATLGATPVALTDMPCAVTRLEASIAANRTLWGESNGVGGGSPIVRAHGLRWGSDTTVGALLRADCVLCSDLIYAGDADTTRELVRTVVALDPTVLVSCHEVRFEGSEAEEKRFFGELAAAGFGAVEVIPFEALNPAARDENICVRLVRKSG